MLQSRCYLLLPSLGFIRCPINAILVPLDVEFNLFYVRFSFSASSFSTLFQLYRIDRKIIRQIYAILLLSKLYLIKFHFVSRQIAQFTQIYYCKLLLLLIVTYIRFDSSMKNKEWIGNKRE